MSPGRYQQSTPPQSPQQHQNSHLPSSQAVSDNLNPDWADPEPTGIIEGPRSHVPTPESVTYLEWRLGYLDESDPLFERVSASLQDYQRTFELPQSQGIELDATVWAERQRILAELSARDNLSLFEELPLEYPSPPSTPTFSYRTHYPSRPSTPVMATTISDGYYEFPSLKGRENYHTWKIQMRDMFEEFELWSIVDGTTTRSATDTAAQSDFDKKNRQALGIVRRRVESAPMTHVAQATTANGAWEALKHMYESIGTAAMTLLRNKFTSMRMDEEDDLELHIQKARQVLDELNVALAAEGITKVNELEFIRQFLVSLPESWSVLVSVIDQTPETGDPNGVQLCQRILSRLLTEWHRRKAAGTTGQTISAFWTGNRNVNRPANLNNHIDTRKCYNCGITGHIARECRKPGGGAYNRRYPNENRHFNDNRRQNDNSSHDRDNHYPENIQSNDQQANFAYRRIATYDPETAFAFSRPIIPSVLPRTPRQPSQSQAQLTFATRNTRNINSGPWRSLTTQREYSTQASEDIKFLRHSPDPTAPYATNPPLKYSSEVPTRKLEDEAFHVEVLSEGERRIEMKSQKFEKSNESPITPATNTVHASTTDPYPKATESTTRHSHSFDTDMHAIDVTSAYTQVLTDQPPFVNVPEVTIQDRPHKALPNKVPSVTYRSDKFPSIDYSINIADILIYMRIVDFIIAFVIAYVSHTLIHRTTGYIEKIYGRTTALFDFQELRETKPTTGMKATFDLLKKVIVKLPILTLQLHGYPILVMAIKYIRQYNTHIGHSYCIDHIICLDVILFTICSLARIANIHNAYTRTIERTPSILDNASHIGHIFDRNELPDFVAHPNLDFDTHFGHKSIFGIIIVLHVTSIILVLSKRLSMTISDSSSSIQRTRLKQIDTPSQLVRNAIPKKLIEIEPMKAHDNLADASTASLSYDQFRRSTNGFFSTCTLNYCLNLGIRLPNSYCQGDINNFFRFIKTNTASAD